MSNEPNSERGESSGESEIDADDVQLKEQRGFGKTLVRLIAAAPLAIIILGLLAGALFIVTGSIQLNATISGTLPISTVWKTVVAPFLLFLLLAGASVWLLATMAWFGASGVIRIGRVIEQMVRDYNGGNR